MVWSISGSNSPMNNHKAKNLPMVDSFRNYFLTRHGVSLTNDKDCKKLNILFIWRRDYVAHPRNPTGKIRRKIKNGIELLQNAQNEFPHYSIKGMQMDKLSMKEQVAIISKTNILIGMHGAGMSHVLFLPAGSGVIELFPYDTLPSNIHFKAMSRWRQLTYTSWQNVQQWNDFPEEDSSYIPPNVIITLLRLTIKKICY